MSEIDIAQWLTLFYLVVKCATLESRIKYLEKR
jgi:hypothetical protein